MLIKRLIPLLVAIPVIAVTVVGLPPEPVAAQTTSCGPTVTVQRGDTLYSIASRCGTSVGEILAANPWIFDQNVIIPGQRLAMPGTAAGPTPTPSPVSPPSERYVVRPGDTLFSIAQRYGTTVGAIQRANPQISSPDVIRVGQALLIPGVSSGPELVIRPRSGPPGTRVDIRGSGFPGNRSLRVGMGRWRSEFSEFQVTQTNAGGEFLISMAIPASAEFGSAWVFGVIEPASLAVTSGIFTVARDVSNAPVFEEINVFYIALGGGNVGCGDRVDAVQRLVQPTQAPLRASLQALLDTQSRTPPGTSLYNALYRTDLHIQRLAIENRVAMIDLVGEFQIGGTCDAPRVAAQLRETALQFATVDSVRIRINGQTLEQILSGR